MSHQVHYHQHGRQAIVLHVVKDHKNGKFDLARDAGAEAIITDIVISDEIGDGKATPVELAKIAKKAAKKADAKKPAEEEQDEEGAKDPSPSPTPDGSTPPPDE